MKKKVQAAVNGIHRRALHRIAVAPHGVQPRDFSGVSTPGGHVLGKKLEKHEHLSWNTRSKTLSACFPDILCLFLDIII